VQGYGQKGMSEMNLEEFVQMLNRQSEDRKVGRVPQMDSPEGDVFELEEDMGALRLLRLQAALKEKRILESKG
jgi:hypothetical protein